MKVAFWMFMMLVTVLNCYTLWIGKANEFGVAFFILTAIGWNMKQIFKSLEVARG